MWWLLLKVLWTLINGAAVSTVAETRINALPNEVDCVQDLSDGFVNQAIKYNCAE